MCRKVLRDRVAWALKWTGLDDRANDLVGSFSGGMKRRVNLACGVMHNPKILLLDEPTVGVDPQSRERIFQMLDELNASGTSILLTTHHLDEAEQRSDRIVILDSGMCDRRWNTLGVGRPDRGSVAFGSHTGRSTADFSDQTTPVDNPKVRFFSETAFETQD